MFVPTVSQSMKRGRTSREEWIAARKSRSVWRKMPSNFFFFLFMQPKTTWRMKKNWRREDKLRIKSHEHLAQAYRSKGEGRRANGAGTIRQFVLSVAAQGACGAFSNSRLPKALLMLYNIHIRKLNCVKNALLCGILAGVPRQGTVNPFSTISTYPVSEAISSSRAQSLADWALGTGQATKYVGEGGGGVYEHINTRSLAAGAVH